MHVLVLTVLPALLCLSPVQSVGFALNALLEPIRQAFSTPEMQALVARAYPKELEGASSNEVGQVILDDDEAVEAAAAGVAAASISSSSQPAAAAASSNKTGKAAKAPAAAASSAPQATGPVDIARLDIKVGRVVKCEKHPHADKLYLSSVDVGEAEPRQVVSGLKEFIPLEAMQQRLVTVLCNLKPTSLQGVKSHAMLLAASSADHTRVELLDPPAGAKVGERVSFAGFPVDASIPELARANEKVLKAVMADLRTDESGVATYKGVPFNTSAGVVKVQSLNNATIA